MNRAVHFGKNEGLQSSGGRRGRLDSHHQIGCIVALDIVCFVGKPTPVHLLVKSAI